MPDRDMFKKFRRQLGQFNATRGRGAPPSVMKDYLEAELSAEKGRRLETARFESTERERIRRADLEERQLKNEAGAAKVSGAVQLTSLGLELAKTRTGSAALKRGIGVAKQVAGMGAPDIAAATTTAAPVVGAYSSAGPVSQSAQGLTYAETAGQISTPAATTAPSVTGTAVETAANVVGGAAAIYGGEKLVQAGHTRTGRTVQGAGAGAIAGSFIPGVGTVVGAGLGYVWGAIEDDATVICTELNRQGYIPDIKLKLDAAYRSNYIDNNTYKGYMKWAPYVVKAMQKSWIITQLVRPFGVGWVNYTSQKFNRNYKSSIIGWALYKIGVPICRTIGRVTNG